MARRTNAQLEARIAELEAIIAARCPVTKGATPKGACLVYADRKPFYSAFSHRAAFKLMSAIKGRGVSSLYKPY